MPEPHSFGWFHLLWIALIGAWIFVAIRFAPRDSERVFKTFSLALGVAMLAMEAYKQLVFAYDAKTDSWSYPWGSFPFQFCSTPMYLLPIIACLNEGKLRNCLCCFLATYGFVGGFAVFVYPETVFIQTIGVNIQTMLHHGGMIVYAIYLFATKRVGANKSAVWNALPVFLVLCAAALTMNLLYGDGEAFNMFFIAPGGAYLVPIVDFLFSRLPYIVYLFSYLIFFTVAAYLVTLLFKLLQRK